MSWPWSQLGLSGPSDLSQVRRAYAEKLKTTHPEDDPEGFQRLHSAYQLASRMARAQKKRQDAPPVPPPEGERTPPPPREKQDFDFDELLQDGGEPPRRGPEEEQDFDFDELLQGGGEPPRRGPEEEQDFDFDELLQGGEEPPRRGPEEERDFDFDELLQGGEEPPRRGPEEERDFDFDRLFAEGEAERAEARRRRAEERRRAQAQAQAWRRERQKAGEWTEKREQWQRREQRNTYDRERRDQFDQEQRKWQDTEAILHAIEMMVNSRADRAAWEKFFQSPLFQRMKGELDLIFGLEDLVSARQDLSQGARTALFRAYGFEKGVSRPELRPLYQLLLPAWQAAGGEKRREGLYKLLGAVGGAIAVLAAGAILTSALLPVFLVLGGTLLYGLNRGWFKRKPESRWEKLRNQGLLWLVLLGGFTCVCYQRGWGLKLPLAVLAVGLACLALRAVLRAVRQDGLSGGRPGNIRDGRWIVALTAASLAVGLSMLFMPEFQEGLRFFSKAEDPREQVCHYLELDYGTAFRSLYTGSDPRFDNVFAPEDAPERLFLAGPDGDRVVREGKPGYTTNYPDMMVLWALQDFTKAWGLRELDLMNRNQELEVWSTTGVYLIVLPFSGAGETITALGELLEEMKGADWYQARPPEFKVVLCGEQMSEGRIILQEYLSSEGDFDAAAARALYEESFAHACCAQLLREYGLDRDFVRGGEESYTLTAGGTAEIRGEPCWRLLGLDGAGNVAMEYAVAEEGGSIFCVPGGFWEEGGTEEDLQFYRVLHREGMAGFRTLYYPWITPS